jgi:hypothetical protein
MNCVTIKGGCKDDWVTVETYDTDTNAVGGLSVSVSDLWRLLWECRPCQVRMRGRIYALQRPQEQARGPSWNVYASEESWRAN